MVQQYQCITAALVFGCILWLLMKTRAYDRRKLRQFRALARLGTVICLLVIVRLTLWRPGGESPGAYDLRLFWSYGRWLTESNTLDVILQVYFNIELYIPLGLCLHTALPRRYSRWLPVLIALGLSMLTEIMQWVCGSGLCELDDIWHNTLGALIGVGLSDAIDTLVRSHGPTLPERYWNGLRTRRAAYGLLPCVLTMVFFEILRGVRVLIQ